MRQTSFCTILLTVTLVLPTHSQTPQFQTDTANEAVAEYLKAVLEARRECLARLSAAETEASKIGDRTDAERIRIAKAAIDGHRPADVFDPFDTLEHQIADTKWANADNSRLWSAFNKDHTLRNSKGDAGKWAVVSDNTIASTTGVRYVYLWVFDDDGQHVTLQRFNHDKSHSRAYVKQ
jgi:hypothetical protein